MAKTPVIKAVNLSKTFKLGKDNEIVALHSVNFEIYSGELICFFGPSGCGKSTLLSMLAGLQPPTSGEVIVRGKNLANYKKKELSAYRREKIGMVFQQFNLILSMTVLENIALPMAFGGMKRKRRMQRALHLLEVVGLGEKKKSVPADLSGGQQQKVAIARSLINNPWIIMADEPTGNLDSKSADDVIKLLISLSRKSKRTVILITHNPDYLQYADRVFRMKDGRIDKIDVNAKTTKVELVDSVSKLDKLKENENSESEEPIFSSEIGKIEDEKKEVLSEGEDESNEIPAEEDKEEENVEPREALSEKEDESKEKEEIKQ
ncbi:MAG: ABC transporter ATP-binding protein [Patescibacteria group bacterium]